MQVVHSGHITYRSGGLAILFLVVSLLLGCSRNETTVAPDLPEKKRPVSDAIPGPVSITELKRKYAFDAVIVNVALEDSVIGVGTAQV